jgi:hypothetical protein
MLQLKRTLFFVSLSLVNVILIFLTFQVNLLFAMPHVVLGVFVAASGGYREPDDC